MKFKICFQKRLSMKHSAKIIYTLLLLFSFANFSFHTQAAGENVCVENFNPDFSAFQFKVRSISERCSGGEKEMKMQRGPAGTLLFLPAKNAESAPDSKKSESLSTPSI